MDGASAEQDTNARTVLVAVKALSEAKTRLASLLDPETRTALVLAMLSDTVSAARRCPGVGSVHVVSPDADVLARAAGMGASGFADPTSTLNDALTNAALQLCSDAPTLVLQPDLPALRTADLRHVLSRSGSSRVAVPDAAGTGTTVLHSPTGAALHPLFGPGSACAHASSGARLLSEVPRGLRTDVDTAEDLADALAIGVGPATAAVLDSTGTVATVAGPAAEGYVLRTDDGRRLDVATAVVRQGGWRALRVGQRVRALTDVAGVVRLLVTPVAVAPG
ncbi:MAG: 2-phospho-L-lactate guanylyltransferase [Mycobacteriaceae bacterium]